MNENMEEREIINKYFENFRFACDDILRLKNNNAEHTTEYEEKRKSALLLFVAMKKINRLIKYKIRQGRDDLHQEKVLVDSNRLQLQNLLYEVNHLKREIRYCHQFKSQDEDIELMPEEEYISLLKPQNVPVPSTDHEKRLVHLKWELDLRKHLSNKCKDLLNSKKSVFEEIVSKMERFTSFAPSLLILLKATQPLQEALQVPMDQDWKIEQLVQLLPQPLYLVYINMQAVQLRKKAEFEVVVVGSEEEVHECEIEENLDNLRSNASSDTEDDVITRKKSIHVPNNLSQQRNNIFKPHPLVVQFTIGNVKNPADCLVVILRYFRHFGFVTASTSMNLIDSDIAGETHLLKDILRYLYDNDSGETIPRAGVEYELNKLNMTTEEYLRELDGKDLGRPYRWLQRMCCLKLEDGPDGRKPDEKTEKIIEQTLNDIQKFWNARLNLIKQVRALANKNIDCYLKDEKMPTSRPSCSLVQWTAVTWEEYALNASTKLIIAANAVDSGHVFYRAVVVRGSAKMECLLSIGNKFPTDSPIWVISVFWNGQHNAQNNSAIKAMEYWTNCLKQSDLENKSALLSAQLHRTMYSFDIFLETESCHHSPSEYNIERHYVRLFTKKMRARPFRYVADGSANSFKQ